MRLDHLLSKEFIFCWLTVVGLFLLVESPWVWLPMFVVSGWRHTSYRLSCIRVVVVVVVAVWPGYVVKKK